MNNSGLKFKSTCPRRIHSQWTRFKPADKLELWNIEKRLRKKGVGLREQWPLVDFKTNG